MTNVYPVTKVYPSGTNTSSLPLREKILSKAAVFIKEGFTETEILEILDSLQKENNAPIVNLPQFRDIDTTPKVVNNYRTTSNIDIKA